MKRRSTRGETRARNRPSDAARTHEATRQRPDNGWLRAIVPRSRSPRAPPYTRVNRAATRHSVVAPSLPTLTIKSSVEPGRNSADATVCEPGPRTMSAPVVGAARGGRGRAVFTAVHRHRRTDPRRRYRSSGIRRVVAPGGGLAALAPLVAPPSKDAVGCVVSVSSHPSSTWSAALPKARCRRRPSSWTNPARDGLRRRGGGSLGMWVGQLRTRHIT